MGNLLLFLRRNREWEGERDPGHVARAWNPGWQGWPFRVSKIKPMISLLLNVSGLPPTQRPAKKLFVWLFIGKMDHRPELDPHTWAKNWGIHLSQEVRVRKEEKAMSLLFFLLSITRYWEDGGLKGKVLKWTHALQVDCWPQRPKAAIYVWGHWGPEGEVTWPRLLSSLVKELGPELKLSPYVIPSSTLCKHLCP